MANYKELRIMTHEQEFLVNTGQNTYALGNIDLTNVVFFTKSKKATYESAYEPFKVVDGGNYIISNQGTPSCSITFSTGFLDDKERIQVCREFLITSSQYITDEPNSIIVKDKLNQLISELTTLTEIIRKNQPKSDSKDVNHVFPDLLPNETFMMRDDGTLGAVTIDDVNSFIAEARTLINEHTTLKESELDTYTDTKKTELNSHTNLKIIELNSHTITKKWELDTYNLVKKGELDSYNLVKKGELDTYNETQKTELNNYTEAEKIELNTHTNTKKSELDSYNLTKKSELDSYNLVKIGELDTHTTAKETEINNFTEEQKTEINNFTELQKIEINDLTETKKIEIIEVADDKIAEINNIIIENVYLPIATAVTKGIASFGTGFTVVNGHVTADGTNIVSANDGIIANADNIQLDTQNVLTSTSTTKPLSANMGKVLQDTKLDLTGGTVTNGTNEARIGVKYDNLSTDMMYMYTNASSQGVFSVMPGFNSIPVIRIDKTTGVVSYAGGAFDGGITAPNLAVFSTLDKTSLTPGTTYTNTTGKPMMITAREVNNGAAAARSIGITINGNDVSAADDYGISDLCVTAICPANGTYKVLFSGTSISRATIRQY